MSKPTISLDQGFHFDQVNPQAPHADSTLLAHNPALAAALIRPAVAQDTAWTAALSAPLGDLVGFTNPVDPTQSIVFAGTGFSMIFRPQSPSSPTPLPVPVPGSDNILELNLTAETITFSAPLGNVPNRGSGTQPDIFLNGVPYVQSVNDITTGTATGIHFEPGMWIAVPPTTVPPVPQITYARMASIPHGATINAEGISLGSAAGRPVIFPSNINPFPIGGAQPPIGQHAFASQVVATQHTARIPQDLTPFISAGTITQAMLDDPNTVLRAATANQNVLHTTTIVVTTDPANKLPTPVSPPAPPPGVLAPGFGGGSGEIAFLLGDANTPPHSPNANAFKTVAAFWIETIQVTLTVPPCKASGLPIIIQAPAAPGNTLQPTFVLTPPHDLPAAKTITVTYIQLQYSQTVFLNFAGLTWPHVSVATLIPSAPIPVPASVWA